ncbi:hypothetical protein LCGC14_1386380 [marine sediment metagenome]|uniref:Uncharacterized protein n=1 Tax=marine sediment metagenome TaxID=412755 RepID=A0A0F9K1I8_9ZZZZ
MNKYLFEEARKLYPGRKRGFQPEWDDFVKKHKRRIDDICPLLTPAIEKQIAYRERTKEWCAQWKNFKTWLYGSWWTEIQPQSDKPKPRRCFHCGNEDVAKWGFEKPPCCWRTKCKTEYARL